MTPTATGSPRTGPAPTPPNVVLLCSRHHHTLHNPGWHTKARPDRAIEITKPNGQTLTSQPPGKPPDLFNNIT